jgi:hypothetical protein
MAVLLKTISDSDTTLMFSSALPLPLSNGAVVIGTEIITYVSNYSGTLYGCIRGARSTTPAAHLLGATINLLDFYSAGADTGALNADNLTSGTVPDARFPAVLPAVSGANLTNLPSSGGSLIKATKVTSNSVFLADDNSYNTITSVTYAPVSATAIIKVTAFFNLADAPITANGDVRLTQAGNVLTSQAYNVTAWASPQTVVGFWAPAGASLTYSLRARCTASTPAGGFSTGSEQIFIIEEIAAAA